MESIFCDEKWILCDSERSEQWERLNHLDIYQNPTFTRRRPFYWRTDSIISFKTWYSDYAVMNQKWTIRKLANKITSALLCQTTSRKNYFTKICRIKYHILFHLQRSPNLLAIILISRQLFQKQKVYETTFKQLIDSRNSDFYADQFIY